MNSDFNIRIEKAKKAIEDADYILLGGGAGLSDAAGLEYSGENFEENFASFIEKYGFTDLYSAGFYKYETQEERWAYWANCADKIERGTSNINGVKSATVDFVSKKLIMEINNTNEYDEIIEQVNKIVNKIEPDVNIILDHDIKSKNNNQVEEKDNGNKKELIMLAIGAIIFGIAMFFEFSLPVEFILYFISYILVGGKVVLRALKNISRGQIFDENFLMSVATIGAFSIGQFPEGVAVMLFYQIGEFFQDIAVNQSRTSISALMDIRPDFANLKKDGDIRN